MSYKLLIYERVDKHTLICWPDMEFYTYDQACNRGWQILAHAKDKKLSFDVVHS